MTFEAIIFDLDGTLLNSIVGIADAMNILLRRLGYPTHSEETYKQFVGEGIVELVTRAVPAEKREAHDTDELVAGYRSIYAETWPDSSPPYEGIPELLDALASMNKKLSVLSNKSDDFTRRMVSALLPRWTFEVVRGVLSDGRRKPDPFSALEIAGKTGIAPVKTMFVGDSAVDMQTAVNAGMYGVGVLWGFRGAEEMLENGARKLIEHPMALLDLFQQHL